MCEEKKSHWITNRKITTRYHQVGSAYVCVIYYMHTSSQQWTEIVKFALKLSSGEKISVQSSRTWAVFISDIPQASHRKTAHDPVFVRPMLTFNKNSNLFGVIGIQANDTMFIGNPKFVNLENEEITKTKTLIKPVVTWRSDNQIIFNDEIISQTENLIQLKLKNQCDWIKLINTENPSFERDFHCALG